MKLSNTSTYALRILSFMAREPEVLYSAKFLVEQLNISDKYLRRLMTQLTKSGFIKSAQGRVGGYSFAKAPNQITLADIIESVEGMQKYTGCVLGFDACSDENPCVMHSSWVVIREELIEVLTKKTLADFNYNDVHKL